MIPQGTRRAGLWRELGPQLACGLGWTGMWMSPSQEMGKKGRVEKGLQTRGCDPGRTAAAGMEEEGERPGEEGPHGEDAVAGTGRDKSTMGRWQFADSVNAVLRTREESRPDDCA